MVNAYKAEGLFGDVAALDDVDRRRWSGKGYIATDDLQNEAYHGELRWQGVMQLLGASEDEASHQHWAGRKPALTDSGTAGARNLVASAGTYTGLNGKYLYAVVFDEASSGWDDIPFADDSASTYYVEAFGVEIPTDVSVDRDTVIRYSQWQRVVGFSKLAVASGDHNNNLEMVPGVDAVTEPVPGSLKIDITTQVGGAWAAVGAGARTRPVVAWKQSATEQNDNRGAVTQDESVAIFHGLASSDGVNVTVLVPHTFGQGGSPSLVASDYTVVVLGPLVDTTSKFGVANSLIFATYDAGASTLTAGAFVVGTEYEILSIGSTDFTLIGAAANTVGLRFTATGVGAGTGTAREIPFAYEDTPAAPTQKAFAGIWTPIPLSPIGGHIQWDLGAPATTAWVFSAASGNVWRTLGGVVGRQLYFELCLWPLGRSNGLGHKLVIRKFRIRAESNVLGDYVEVTLKRHDLNGADLNMDSGAPRQFDSVTTEMTLVPDVNNVLEVDPSAVGPDSHSIIVLVKANGADTTTYTFTGIDVLWELVSE